MNDIKKLGQWLAAPAIMGASLTVAGEGEIRQVCNCRGGGGAMAMPAAPMPNYMPPVMSAAPLTMPPVVGGACVGGGPGGLGGAVAPPPGTLGRTYTLKTRLIPAEKHPRVGMLELRTSAQEVYVSHTNEFREEDDVKGFQSESDPTLWLFETKPLIQGIPHVYKIELVNGGVITGVQYVRMIRGRVIELSL